MRTGTRSNRLRAFAITRLFALAVLTCFASVAAVQAKGYMTAGFQSKQSRPARLVLLPPHAEFIKEKVIMTDQMLKESAALENEAAVALKAQLEEKGYKVRILTPAEIEKTPGLRGLVKQVNDRYNEEWSRIVTRPKKVKEHRYSAGEVVLKICSLFKADGIALARIQAVGVSKGKATFSAIMNMGPPPQRSYARIDLSVIEGKRGYVEGYFSGFENTSLSQLVKKPALVMAQASENALRKYPEAAEVRQVDEAAASEEQDKEADVDPVKDFEALLATQPQPKK